MLEEYLVRASVEMGVPLTPEQAAMLARFHEMLQRANEGMNLTRVSADWREAADRNYLDSIAPAAYIPAGTAAMADVGTGAGFPGIPLAILRPDIRVTLMDSLAKRVEFLESVVRALGLNARAVHIRAEEAGHMAEYRDAFDVVVSRAVAPMNVLCEFCLPLVRPGGQLLAMKGPGLEDELAEAQRALAELGGAVAGTYRLPIPGRDWDHRLAAIAKVSPTPEKYPRRPGMPEKRPLR